MVMHLSEQYFEWMYEIVCKNRYDANTSYRKLLERLHEIEFTWVIQKDSNRAEDGKDLRWRFAYLSHIPVWDELYGPCSVFEMILALAIRCEETIMDDPSFGDRTAQWFWKMITNLGLGSMTDERFDKKYVDEIISMFLNRDYAPDGRGSLFVVRGFNHDMRDLEIWEQMARWLDTIA